MRLGYTCPRYHSQGRPNSASVVLRIRSTNIDWSIIIDTIPLFRPLKPSTWVVLKFLIAISSTGTSPEPITLYLFTTYYFGRELSEPIVHSRRTKDVWNRRCFFLVATYLAMIIKKYNNYIILYYIKTSGKKYFLYLQSPKISHIEIKYINNTHFPFHFTLI